MSRQTEEPLITNCVSSRLSDTLEKGVCPRFKCREMRDDNLRVLLADMIKPVPEWAYGFSMEDRGIDLAESWAQVEVPL